MENSLRAGAWMAAFIALAAAFLGGCGSGEGAGEATPAQSATASPVQGRSLISIEVADNSYMPSNLTVPKGTQVTWDWAGKNDHSVKGSWDGKNIESGRQRSGRWSFTFEKAGTFQYQCGVHGAAMSGKVTVKD